MSIRKTKIEIIYNKSSEGDPLRFPWHAKRGGKVGYGDSPEEALTHLLQREEK